MQISQVQTILPKKFTTDKTKTANEQLLEPLQCQKLLLIAAVKGETQGLCQQKKTKEDFSEESVLKEDKLDDVIEEVNQSLSLFSPN